MYQRSAKADFFDFLREYAVSGNMLNSILRPNKLVDFHVRS